MRNNRERIKKYLAEKGLVFDYVLGETVVCHNPMTHESEMVWLSEIPESLND